MGHYGGPFSPLRFVDEFLSFAEWGCSISMKRSDRETKGTASLAQRGVSWNSNGGNDGEPRGWSLSILDASRRSSLYRSTKNAREAKVPILDAR